MDRDFISKHRIDALIDAVIAITMTLLVLEIRAPEHTGPEILAMIVELGPKIISWIVSFLLLAQFWRSQMQATIGLHSVSPRLFQITVVWLLITSTIPFTSSLIGEHNEYPQAHLVYALNLVAIAATVLWRNIYLKGHPELFENGDSSKADLGLTSVVSIGLAATASVTLAYLWEPDYASLAYLILLPANLLFRRLGLD